MNPQPSTNAISADGPLDLSKALPSDIVQISSLLESREESVQLETTKHSLISSSTVDPNTCLAQKHTWHVLDSGESDKTFGLHLRPEEVHLKQIDFEFGFTKKAPGKLAGLEIAYGKGSDDVAPSEPQRLPLAIESNTGSQMNDNIQPNILTSPDSEVFCSNYP